MVQRQGLFRDTAISQAAIREYVELANEWGVTPSQLALAWCKHVDGVTSSIIGATKMSQLEENIKAFDIELSVTQWDQVNAILHRYPAAF
jgi:aryl-alcohol dehydrogenase-like predicted oxidoreductase